MKNFTAGCVGCLGMVVICSGTVVYVLYQGQEKADSALRQADSLYQSGHQAEAVAKYKESFGGPEARSRKSEILKRIVDQEIKAGNTEEAKVWIKKGIKDNVEVPYDSASAKDSFGHQSGRNED